MPGDVRSPGQLAADGVRIRSDGPMRSKSAPHARELAVRGLGDRQEAVLQEIAAT